MDKIKYKITGLGCPSCASLIELDLEDAGIKASCNYTKSTLEVDSKVDKSKVAKIVEKSGYSISLIENW